MKKIKIYVVSLCTMWIVSIVSLVMVSVLTYLFKWQADIVLIGIILVYVLAGVTGGVWISKMHKKIHNNNKRSTIHMFGRAALLASMYILLATIISLMFLENTLEFTRQTIMIWILAVGSVYIGENIVK